MNESSGARWDGSLEGLFSILDDVCRQGALPGRILRVRGGAVALGGAGSNGGGMGADRGVQPELFEDVEIPSPPAVDRGGEEGRGGAESPAREVSGGAFWELGESLSAGLLLELSVDAFDRFVYAWMSELPLEAEIIRFGWKVIRAARAAGEGAGQGRQSGHWAASAEARLGAEQAASDRGDPDVRAVLEAAYKVCREIDRLQGLLRFSPMDGGSGSPVYLARCCPDHYVLPGLSGHFTRRFGETSWVIADEKRNLALAREPGGEARLFPLASRCVGQSLAPGPENPGDSGVSGDHDQPRDYFEELWRNYHRSVNNPDRNNPALQRCFMPRRYWKYLPEVQ